MSAEPWLGVIGAGASAGAYGAGLVLLATRRWRGAAGAFPPVVTATVLFCFARGFPNTPAFSILAAMFAAIAIVQLLRERDIRVLVRIFAAVPPAVMLLVSAGDVAGSAFQPVLVALLSVPAVAAALAALRNLYLIRKAAFNRV